MKTYQVTLRMSGTLCLQVEADSEADAVTVARQQCTLDDVENWEETNAGAEVEECVDTSIPDAP